MLTMNAFYARFASPVAPGDAFLRRLVKLGQASLGQIRAFKVATTWDPWGGNKA